MKFHTICFLDFWCLDLAQAFSLVSVYFMVVFTSMKDYYKVLEVDYDATEEKIRLNYRRLALVCRLSFLIALKECFCHHLIAESTFQ